MIHMVNIYGEHMVNPHSYHGDLSISFIASKIFLDFLRLATAQCCTPVAAVRMYQVEWLTKRQVILLAAALELVPCVLMTTVKDWRGYATLVPVGMMNLRGWKIWGDWNPWNWGIGWYNIGWIGTEGLDMILDVGLDSQQDIGYTWPAYAGILIDMATPWLQPFDKQMSGSIIRTSRTYQVTSPWKVSIHQAFKLIIYIHVSSFTLW